jgi:hypothetical protein
VYSDWTAFFSDWLIEGTNLQTLQNNPTWVYNITWNSVNAADALKYNISCYSGQGNSAEILTNTITAAMIAVISLWQ